MIESFVFNPFLYLLVVPEEASFKNGVVPCGGPKMSPRTSSIVQIIFLGGPLRSARVF